LKIAFQVDGLFLGKQRDAGKEDAQDSAGDIFKHNG
jgi:hypothetical protein